jgi:hypothetical protein
VPLVVLLAGLAVVFRKPLERAFTNATGTWVGRSSL